MRYFFNTLLETNWTYEYFVDWDKVRQNVKKFTKEICLLNALTKIGPENRRRELKDIFLKYPETVPAIPLIIAVREKKISIFEVAEKTIKLFDFAGRVLHENEADMLVDFCEKAGILQLFSEIKDLYDYLLGVEVGLDTNARKNRSGKIFQELVDILLKGKLSPLTDIELKTEDQSIKTVRRKKADFVIYLEGKPKIVIECNFYHTTGSKPIETANAYIDFQKKARERGIDLIWLTDGPAWSKMKPTILQSFREIDYPMNYTLASEKIADLVSLILKG
ncbi:MAG: type II restriction endonuclease [Candidatus Bathyarchaeia archaeon]